jgi:Tol biopolymer transport system component
MALASNSTFGNYRIGEVIGEGGMGQVYLATDTTLDRKVAIKVLPESFAQDTGRIARFEREAKTLASLNHNNIAQIFGIEKGVRVADSDATQPITAIVMELVEGPTLAERLEQGPIPVDEALGIAMLIAEALEAAHERGIVHRDLKPANIKVKADGSVKVLDFGIAKALDTTTISGPQAAQLTTPAMTEAGVILGTAAYMSPEQARGKQVDQRADIWAFGCLLYEMLTGQPAFGGEDVTTTLARILERGADLSALPATLSLDVRQAIKLCLEKDVRKRVADIRDVKLALTGAFETGTAMNIAAVAATAARGRLGWMLAFAASLAVIAVMSFPALQHLREETLPPPPETRLELVTPATNAPTDFALSPDGRQIVFVASDDSGTSQLWLRSLANTTTQPLAGTEGAQLPFWSPDGRAIGFFAGNVLKRLDPGGGAPQTLTTITLPLGVAWGADNSLLFSANTVSPLMRVSASGGERTAVTTLEPGQTSHGHPYFLPDGRRFLFFVGGTPGTAGIYLGHLDGSAPVRLTAADSAGVYHPDGWLLWLRAGTLTAQRLDLAQAALTGEPRTLADGVATAGNLSALSVASTGLIAYRTGATSGQQLTWVDRAGTVLGTLGEPDSRMFTPRLSPDGRRVGVFRTVQGNADIWLLDGARTSRFTFDAAADTLPLWSPDGGRIVFFSNRTGVGNLYQKSSSGAGEETLLLGADQTLVPSSWSADGRFLLYSSASPQTGRDLWALPMSGDPAPFVVLQTPFNEVWGIVSPDSRWVAYQSNESGRNEIYVRAFMAPGAPDVSTAAVGGQWQISTAGGIHPSWSPDGQALYYLDSAGNMLAASFIATGDTVAVGTPDLLFATHIVGGGADIGAGRQYDIASDGRFLINTVGGEGASDPITLIMNWDPEAVQ